MKFLFLIALIVLISALTITTEDKSVQIEEQIEHSHELHDSAMLLLQEIHKHNDSLIDVYFPL
jgi:hypothetical protein